MIISKENIHKTSVSSEIIWNSFSDFGSYAFNKSHSVAYALIAYQTAKLWAHNKKECLEYSFNNDTKERYSMAIDKCRELNFQCEFPTIHNMNHDSIIVENGKLIFPGNAKRNYDSYVEFLFDPDNRDVATLIYEGVCDNITKDRKALAELVLSLQAKAKQQAYYMETGDSKFTTLTQILDGLKLCGGIENYSYSNGEYNVFVKRARTEPTLITFHKSTSNKVLLDISTFDKKYFGIVRNNVIDNCPYINTIGIINTIERTKERKKNNGKSDREIYYDLKSLLDDYMRENFSDSRKKVFEDVKAIVTDIKNFDGKCKLTLLFNDKEEFYYTVGECSHKAKSIKKNTLVKLTMEYSPFIRKATNEFIYDFDITNIKEVKEEI